MNNFTKLICAAALVAAGTTAASAQTLYDNFETTRIVSYPIVEGTLVQNAANPGSTAVNGSPTCASYMRGAGQYSVLVVKPNNAKMDNVTAYTVGGAKRISVKFRSPAVGVTVGVVLQNSRLNTANYPTGKFGTEFTAVTTKANDWEVLTFTPTAAGAGNFDGSVMATDIDQMLFQVAPGTNGTATYYLDDIMGPELLAVAPPSNLAVRQLYDNYEGTRAIKYIAYKTSGGLKLDTLNNASGTGNTSTRVARYTRSTNQYDSFVMQPRGAAINDVTNFKSTSATAPHMTLRVFSVVPGVLYQITLQDSTVAGATNYPAGRNSEYTATTTATNAWENLSFNFTGSPSGTANTSVNEIVLLVAPNTTVKRKVYLDDFYGPSLVGFVATATRTIASDFAAFAPAYPNPTSGITQLPFSLKKAATVSLAVYDNLGRRVTNLLNDEPRAAGQHTTELNAAKLAPGLYTCRLTVDGVALSRPLSVE